MSEILPKIAICGPSRCGKDTAANWLAQHTHLRFSRSTSEVIAPVVATRLGITPEQAFSDRHNNRQFWYEVGLELCMNDPAFLIRETLRDGEITVGMRTISELKAIREAEIVDVIICVDRKSSVDPTIELRSDMCDLVIPNNGTLDEFHSRLQALAKMARLFK